MEKHSLLTAEQTAKSLGIAPITLACWRVRGQGPAFIKDNPNEKRSRVRYRAEDIERWQQQRRCHSTSEYHLKTEVA